MTQTAISRTVLATLVGFIAIVMGFGLVYMIRATRSKPAPFVQGDRIAVGSHTVSFRDVEAFTPAQGGQGLAVFFRWEGEPPVGYLKLALFFKSHFRLVDANGKKYSAATAMSAEAFRSRQRGQTDSGESQGPWRGRRGGSASREQDPQDWVAVFHVPQESRGFTLLFDHPTPRREQADFYAAPLGR